MKGAETVTAIGRYCAAVLALQSIPPPEGFESLPRAQQERDAKEVTRKLVPLGERIRSRAPVEIRASIDVLADTLRQMAETGDLSLFRQPHVREASARARAFESDRCGWGESRVVAAGYSYRGLPRSLPPGPRRLELMNADAEGHELVVARVTEGAELNAEALVALPGAEFNQLTARAGYASAAQQDSDFILVKLQPGRYVLACLIPVAGETGDATHATRGMVRELTVTRTS